MCTGKFPVSNGPAGPVPALKKIIKELQTVKDYPR